MNPEEGDANGPKELEFNFDPELTYGPPKATTLVKRRTESAEVQGKPCEMTLQGEDPMRLTFKAFFSEAIDSSQEEKTRVRHVNIQIFLKDSSIKISEKAVENSGLPQGVLLKRQVVSKGPGQGNFGPSDFVPGQDVTVFSRKYTIVGVDNYTRNWCSENGIDLPEDASAPVDEYMIKRGQMAKGGIVTGRRGHDSLRAQTHLLKRFLEHDGLVLRFYAEWDDTAQLYGEKHRFIVHHFLVDNTCEVRELSAPNAGRDGGPVFLKRSLLPKQYRGLDDVLTPAGAGGAPITTPLPSTGVYKDEDLAVGGVLRVFNRDFKLFACDGATARYYSEKYGTDTSSWTILSKPNEAIDVEDPTHDAPAPMQLPNEGIAALSGDMMRAVKRKEDAPALAFTAASSALSHQNPFTVGAGPAPPKLDVVKQLENQGRVLRFGARLDTTQPEDQGRRFVLSFYLADDTISVFERAIRNSGIDGGTFLKRSKMVNPVTGSWWEAAEWFLGAEIGIHGRKFILEEADDFALNWMEAHPQEFPYSSAEIAFDQAKGEDNVADAIGRAFAVGPCPETEAKKRLSQAVPTWNPQQILAVVRFAKDASTGLVDPAKIIEALA